MIATADLRYAGQQSSLGIPVGPRRRGWIARLEREFHAQHEQLFGFWVPGEPVEVVALRLRAIGRLAPDVTSRAARTRRRDEPAAMATRPIAFGPAERDRVRTRVFRREAILPGAELHGPAVVEQDDATTLVPPGAWVRCDALGNLLITR
jgi:N-methylhydantoinase A